jgi:hypothetical protein
MPTNFNWIINQDIMKVGMFHANPQPMMWHLWQSAATTVHLQDPRG